MPGPNSAPNGQRILVTNPVRRNELADKGKLVTGKTEASRGELVKEVR